MLAAPPARDTSLFDVLLPRFCVAGEAVEAPGHKTCRLVFHPVYRPGRVRT